MLGGLFEGWPNPPGPDTFLLRGASRVAVAVEDGQVVGFMYAISDALLSAYIPLLEVGPEWSRQEAAPSLTIRLLAQLLALV